MANKKKKNRKSAGAMRRTDIPYAQRLQLQQITAIKEVRDYSAKAILFCQSIALHELEGIGYKRLVRYSLVFRGLIDEFYEDLDVGMDRARRRMAQHGIEISEDISYPRVQGLTHKQQEQHDHAMQASYVAHLVGLIAINETFGFGKDKLEQLSVRVAELSERLNREGDGFLFEEMEKIGFQVVDGHVVAYVDEDNEAITPKKWREENEGITPEC